MQFHLMREEPANSGTYVDVTDVEPFDTADAAAQAAVERGGEEGARYALRVYESLRTDAQRAADLHTTQAAATAGRPAPQPAPPAQPSA